MTLQKIQIREVPKNIDGGLYKFLVDMRNSVLRMSASVVPPGAVTNLTATGKAGGAIIEFTRSDADSYTIIRNTSKSLDGSTQIEIGNSNRYVDDVGASSQTIYYWVRTKKGAIEGYTAGPVSAITLGLATEITPGEPPPGSGYPARNVETEQVEPGRPSSSDYKKV